VGKPLRLLVLFLLVAMLAAACTGGGEEGSTGAAQQGAQPGSYPREQTLYTSGTQWGPPSNWNPLRNWDYATGTEGFVYEPLFLYDPFKDEYKPWLAASGDWTSDTTYELKLRQGITWSDGKPFTADDVVFTFELGKFKSVPFSTLWNWLQKAEAVDAQTVRFTFSQANYQEWAFYLYDIAMVPKHLWQGRSEQDVATGANPKPVGTGPYLYQTHSQDRMVWVKNDKWWARQQLNLDVKPKYIVDVVNSTNDAALGLVLQGGIDLSNNFLPGIATLVKGGYQLHTFYKNPPYMLSANTAWMFPNTTRKPLDDPAFRKALAASVDLDKIVNGVYGQIVRPADPSGLLPNWDKYIDKSVTGRLGVKHGQAEAKKLLADAGYKDTNGDGLVEAKGGGKIDLELIVPNGWTDWMEAARVIAESAKAAGINVTAAFPEYPALTDARNNGNFDLVIANDRQISNTPWSYYDYVFRLPVQKVQSTTNYGRYENPKAWELVQQLDRTRVDDVEGMRKITSQLQRIQLTEMPVIPLWYNGLWAQANTKVWTNFPAENAGQYLPTTWRNYNEMSSILALTELQPAPKAQ
jgi:peptide/nickel transport system substrate-binding protein